MITPEEAIQLLKTRLKGKEDRIHDALNNRAVPAYNTSVGWLGYCEFSMGSRLTIADAEVIEKIDIAKKAGFNHFKLKAGLGYENDRKRIELVRKEAGPGAILMVR